MENIEYEKLEELLEQNKRDARWAHTRGYYNRIIEGPEFWSGVSYIERLNQNLNGKGYQLTPRAFHELLRYVNDANNTDQ